jgi:hypothetical protein
MECTNAKPGKFESHGFTEPVDIWAIELQEFPVHFHYKRHRESSQLPPGRSVRRIEMRLSERKLSFALGLLIASVASGFAQTSSQPPTNQGVNPYKNQAAGASVSGPAPQQPIPPVPGRAEEDFSGTVQAVDTINRTLTIRTSDSGIVSRLTPGHPITLWAVMKQTPPVSGLRDPNNRQPKADPEAEQFTGTFVSSNQSVMTVRVDSSRALTNVPVGKEVSLMVAGLTPQVTLAPPAPGSQIPPTASATSGSAGEGVVSRSSQATAQPTGAQRITGTIAAVDPATSAVILRMGDGQQVRLPVDYNTRFTLTSAGGSLGDLKLGQQVTATINDNKTTAIELTSGTEGSASAPSMVSPGGAAPAASPGYQNR